MFPTQPPDGRRGETNWLKVEIPPIFNFTSKNGSLSFEGSMFHN